MTFLNNMIDEGFVKPNSFNLYVSQINGSDTTGNGSEFNPFATIMAAITIAATPANETNIIVIDNATYPENIVISANNINLIGPYAYIQPAFGSGLTVITSSGTNNVNFGIIQGGGGSSAIDYSGTLNLFITANSILGDFTTLNGSLTINCYGLLSGNGSVAGSGNINYIANQRSGSDGVNVIGVNPLGTSTTWATGAGITATTGNISATIGNVNAGSNANAGELISYSGVVNTGFLGVKATDNLANVNTELTNIQTTVGTVHALPAVGVGNSTLMAANITDVQQSSIIINHSFVLTAAALAGSALVPIFMPFNVTSSYRILNITMGFGGTNFSGGGGDRDLIITDLTTTYTFMPGSALQTLSNANWGTVNIPLPTAADMNTPTTAGVQLLATYVNGSADYASGSVAMTVTVEKVV